MRQSQLFTKTRREPPKDEVAKNAQLLIQAGYIHKEMAGVYTYLPLGLRVLNKIIAIIREEMDGIGGQEILMTTLQDPQLWSKAGRWTGAADVWFKTKLQAGGELGLGFTHEEPITNIMLGQLSSYKDLPCYAYQFQNKFRNEERAKSGILRTREFIMKDLYSFSRDETEFKDFYEKCAAAYLRIFDRVGLGGKTYRTFASGGSFSKFSDEFQTICEAGEDTIYVHDGRGIAVNKEVYTDEVLSDLGLKKEELKETKAIEVGNIFPLGTRYSAALGLNYRDENGKESPVIMGSYGIGPGRVMGTLVELLADAKGLNWPANVAPYQLHLVYLPGKGTTANTKEAADQLYQKLTKAGVEVLYDDRELPAGEKFADADLLGLPSRLVISDKTLAQNKFELKHRTETEPRLVAERELLELLLTP